MDKSTSKQRWIVPLATPVAMLLLLVLLQHQIMPKLFQWLDISKPPVKTDAVFVLFGDSDVRPFVAAALQKAGFADEILTAEFYPQGNPKLALPAQDVYRHVFAHRGVPENKIRLLPGPIRNTQQECGSLVKYMHQHPELTFTVVTSNYHTRRTRWVFQQQLGKNIDRLHFVGAPVDDFDHRNWWRTLIGFELIPLEFVKLFAYVMVYGRGLWYFAGGSATALVGYFYYARRKRRTRPSDGGENGHG